MKYTFNLLVILIILGFAVLPQQAALQQKIQNLLNDHGQRSVQERLFVHIDNNLVEPGNTIWMKAYLLEQNSSQRSSLSHVLYTDILTHRGEKVLGFKFLLENGIADGAIMIPDTLKYENYILSAYTQEMKNFGEAFTQVLEVRGYNSLLQKCDLVFDKELYSSGDQIAINLETMDINKKSIGKVKYEYRLYNQGVEIANGSGRTDKSGKASHTLDLDKNQLMHKPVIEITTKFEDVKSNFYFNVPIFEKKELAIDFSPEGKVMLEGVEGRIGIKSTDLEGIPVNFRGTIRDENDMHVEEVVIQSNGIGSAQFTPKKGGSYYLKIPGLDRKYELPEARSEGYAVLLQKSTSDQMEFQLSSLGQMDSLVYVALIGQGKVKFFSTVTFKDQTIVSIPIKNMEMGIAEFCLFNGKGQKLISRPVYVDNNQLVQLDLNLSEGYDKIDQEVELEITAKDGQGRPVTGEFSLSITEDFSVFHKTFKQGNIVSDLHLGSVVSNRLYNKEIFLASDIFQDSNINDALLVLDYKRDDWGNVLRQQNEGDNLSDDDHLIQGIVLDKNDVPQEGVEVIVVYKGSWDRNIITTDKYGIFQLPLSLLSRESRGFIIGLADDKMAKNLKISMKDSEYVPKKVEGLSISQIKAEQETFDGTEGFENAQILPEILVEDENYTQEYLDKRVKYYGSFSSLKKDGSELRQNLYFIDLVKQTTPVANIDYVAGKIVFRGRPKMEGQTFGGGGYPVLFILDGVPVGYDYHDLDYLSVEHIVSLDVIRSSAAVINYGTRAVGGVIIVNTIGNNEIENQPMVNQQKLEQNLMSDLARAISVDFLEPDRKFKVSKDTTEQESMLKSTLYWTPQVAFDENGKAKVKYKNLDLPAKIAIRINGISANDQLGYASKTYFSKF